MSYSPEAKDFLRQFYDCIAGSEGPVSVEIHAMQKGIGFVLLYLAHTDQPVSPSDLAKRLNVSTARIAALLKKMEGRGWIQRCPSPEDGRRTILTLTPAGREKVAQMNVYMLQHAERLCQHISRHDREEFIRILHKIVEVLRR